ncbi:NAD(P)-dependent glycerol-1-phosphate dehydrogenase [Sulfurisphaera tokodaii]|uniref:Glycerol-1-phosphate dehydrogenase [NAD(P)+] n=2 Tax=Sulfurisphaera tokodaii TaxID=111955 RepID=G1PDH_SULTO|nr:NAD(P)-dependent glycerol-1-phosphate dehydrogenase [Sulfurisphaera tokodaii]P58460.1 RecName: Full=Glycerol-1-phosphate dehydrogenase [NAD(P)+]; Short=G1P dehydrogenase; Short=G1PDH; AltName: Full=Enantiomeric glycerophosphate synthase; AltName: Full=sn-glycerol-1-phosphate dehydrogenase [Sulfurisphaera tokodaii str. 7]BAB65322.1 sn-glycerol-1-phosphate dehydrogenase [Sulfurisphaera tokodaii str. 7]HII74980.1 NAD(P)-dependent glycerol-1-phosphate dehydrogenase [Sulfurisphaera tokodaii]
MELKEHIIDLPKKVYIGYDIIDNIKEYILSLNLSGPFLIVTGPLVRKIITDKIIENFKDESVEVVEVKIASIDEVNKVEEMAKGSRINTIIGVGGGNIIDVAKYVAYRIGKEFVSLPTAPSHDGITSPFASIKGLGKPTSVKAKGPIAIIADINVLASAPRRLINAGIGDTIGKITAVRDWQLAAKLRGEYYGDYTASLALMSAKHALSCAKILDKDVRAGVRVLTEALISSGVAMGMAGSTRPASGSEHLFAHAIEILYPDKALHGELVALGTILMAYIHGINWKKIKKAMKKVGLPTKAKQLGIPDEIIIKALTIAHTIRPERYTILGDRGLTWEAAEKIAKETGIID